MSITVSNLTSPRTGEPVKNQFVINVDGVEIFQSYQTPIARRDNGKYIISSDYNYSVTTSKYFNQWLRTWGFTDDEIKKLKTWLATANNGDVLDDKFSMTFTYVDEL